MRLPRTGLGLATIVVALLALVGLWSGPASAVPISAVSSGGSSLPVDPSESVTFFLTPPDAEALNELAAAPVVDRERRLDRLRELLPSADQRQAVTRRLTGLGLRIISGTSWSVTATGPSSLVAGLFGTRPDVSGQPTAAAFRAATGSLPRLPANLIGLVSAAYPTTGGPAAFHHSATGPLAGPDFRNADTPAGVSPSTGGNDGGLTIATLQLADFDSSDLTNYATAHSLSDPVAGGRFKEVVVDGGPSTADDATGGDVEVDLDQESILSTAPSAKQQAYFAPNTQAGFNDVFAHVVDDVTGDGAATAADPHIAALSVSWGECEALTGAANIATTEPILNSLVAAGVTVFTSSGDDGIYDCRSQSGAGLDNSQEDVDYPSSSPVAVAVGGTNLSAAASAPNSGSNWTEVAWSCTDPVSCESEAGTGGTGGGVSGAAHGTGLNQGDFAGFAKPGYQSTALTSGAYAATTNRLVPDIAADGDPATGFELYTSDPQYLALCGGNTCQVGGTSLSSPISAAQLTNLLGDTGHTTGVGDIHSALYSAYTVTQAQPATSTTKAFRDVTTGSNGASADAHVDPSVNAAVGYDTTTGLGAVLWPALTPYLPGHGAGPGGGGTLHDTAKLTVKTIGAKHHRHLVLLADWTTASQTTGPLSAVVTITKNGAQKFSSRDTSGHKTLRAKPGSYTLTITSHDTAGHSTTETSTVTVKKRHHQRHHHRHHRHHHH